MKLTRLIFVLNILAIAFSAKAQSNSRQDNWQLLWEDDFNGTKLDENVWSRTERGVPDWQNTQSKLNDLLLVKDGLLILRGIANPNPVSADRLIDGKISVDADTAQYLTAGIISRGKHAFPPEGRIEVRARLHGAKGAWPAIWLMPFYNTDPWPRGGEIDICERLNHDRFAYQTVHSHFTHDLGKDTIPPHSRVGRINPEEFNVYAVEFCHDSLVFYINDQRTFSYPRLMDAQSVSEGQFPFIKPWHMIIDMQLGGKWVGKVDPNELPTHMEVDWVRQYTRQN